MNQGKQESHFDFPLHRELQH